MLSPSWRGQERDLTLFYQNIFTGVLMEVLKTVPSWHFTPKNLPQDFTGLNWEHLSRIEKVSAPPFSAHFISFRCLCLSSCFCRQWTIFVIMFYIIFKKARRSKHKQLYCFVASEHKPSSSQSFNKLLSSRSPTWFHVFNELVCHVLLVYDSVWSFPRWRMSWRIRWTLNGRHCLRVNYWPMQTKEVFQKKKNKITRTRVEKKAYRGERKAPLSEYLLVLVHRLITADQMI